MTAVKSSWAVICVNMELIFILETVSKILEDFVTFSPHESFRSYESDGTSVWHERRGQLL